MSTGAHKRLDIQGLRAVAVLMVVLFHANTPLITGGYIGVDIFFVISGFLMTGQLSGSLRSLGRIDFWQFYRKRILRLAPAALAVVVITLLFSVLFLSPIRSAGIAAEAAAATAYVPNLWFAWTGTDYLQEKFASPFLQFWSLGLEEQFYLVWPLILASTWLLFRKSVAGLAALLAVITVFSLALSIYLTPIYGPWAFYTLPTRVWEFGIGGLAALLLTRIPYDRLSEGRFANIAGWIGVVLVLAAAVFYDAGTRFPGYAALLPVVGTGLILLFSSTSRRSVGALLQTRPMTFVGDISYSLYLWHWPIILIPLTLAGGSLPLWGTLLLGAASFPLAYLGRRYIEVPAMSSDSIRRVRSWIVVPSAAATIVAVTLAMALGSVALDRRQISTNIAAPEFIANLAASTSVSFTDYVPINAQPRLQSANEDVPKASQMGCSPKLYDSTVAECEFGNKSSPRTFVLFGDSHAAQWFPAVEQLAEAGDVRLVVMIKSGCASIDTPRFDLGDIDRFCEDWKRKAVERLNVIAPDVIFMSNLHIQTGQYGDRVTVDQWNDATARTVDRLPNRSRVVVIADTPWFDESPIQCAADHLDSLNPCAVKRNSVMDPDWVSKQREHTQEVGATFIDMTDDYCSAEFCNLISGNIVIYRDTHHLTATLVSALSPTFRERLLQAGVTI
ncbi:acyltransferase family protein [Rhodococcus sp. NPDC057014]|uniref:acyltransferase family protein n=1 Tax=Rhodococcus sp. NPDC057014 TaxID=3346000 RepID=UPI003634898F